MQIQTTDSPGIMKWKLATSGVFPPTTNWDSVRKKKPISFIAKCCWHKHFSFSVFIWKALNNGSATDDNVQRKGTQLTSKSNCCFKSESAYSTSFGEW